MHILSYVVIRVADVLVQVIEYIFDPFLLQFQFRKVAE